MEEIQEGKISEIDSDPHLWRQWISSPSVAPGQNREQNAGRNVVIYVVATLTVKPETRAEFIAAATACIKETRKEPGNIAYDLHESVTDPSKMVFVEQWKDAEALVPHRAAEHMKAFGRVAVKCMTAPPKIEVITPEKVDVR
jgi:quinol monooxygenase YgiN